MAYTNHDEFILVALNGQNLGTTGSKWRRRFAREVQITGIGVGSIGNVTLNGNCVLELSSNPLGGTTVKKEVPVVGGVAAYKAKYIRFEPFHIAPGGDFDFRVKTAGNSSATMELQLYARLPAVNENTAIVQTV